MNRKSIPPLSAPAPDAEWVAPQQAAVRHRASWPAIVAAVWPTHRAILWGCIGTAAVLATLVLWLHFWASGLIADVSASPTCQGGVLTSDDCQEARWDAEAVIESKQSLLELAGAAMTAGAGVLLGVSAFAREFEQRTQVLLLTQGISRARWWIVKSALAIVPWSLTTAMLGAIFAWALEPIRRYSAPMDLGEFYLSALGLFVVGTVAVCFGVTVGIMLRSTLGAILLAGFLVAAVIGGAEAARPYLVPTDRFVAATGGDYAIVEVPPDSWFQRGGYLNTSGQETVQTANCDDLWQSTSEKTTEAEFMRINRECYARSGIVANYSDVIVPSRFPLVRTLWAAGLLAVSASILAAGFLRIRRRVL